MSEQLHAITDVNFEQEVIAAELPVLVDFYADWCGPCKMIAPILEKIAVAYAGKLRIVKLNVDNNPEVPAKYAIRGIPTLILFKNGQLQATKSGMLSEAQLTAFLDGHL